MFFIFSNFFRGESNVLLTISFSITYFAFSGICLLFDFDHANAPSVFSAALSWLPSVSLLSFYYCKRTASPESYFPYFFS